MCVEEKAKPSKISVKILDNSETILIENNGAESDQCVSVSINDIPLLAKTLLELHDEIISGNI